MRHIAYISLCLMLAGCSMPGMRIRPHFLHLPEGDDPYSTGFREGCDTSLGAVTSGPVAATSPFSYDANRGIEDKKYYDGYRMGANYCTYFSDPGPF